MVIAARVEPARPDVVLTLDYETARVLSWVCSMGRAQYEDSTLRASYLSACNLTDRQVVSTLQPIYREMKNVGVA